MKAATIILGLSLILGKPFMAQDSADSFRLGVQTHFQQGWRRSLIARAHELGAPVLRDEIGWAETEKSPGNYNFARADAYMLPILELGLTPLIVITDTNPLYDDGNTPHSIEGRAAMAAYISAILSHYGSDAVQIEIGNEVNSGDFIGGPFTQDKPAYFAAMVRAVHDRLQIDHPNASLICAGLNTIGIGFYRNFFRRGGLLSCDAISVHPYRDNPDTVAVELERLKALMREYGGEKPIYVTEFGKWFDDPEEAPDYMVKMVTQMAAIGVEEAYWYALRDEPWWPNMGLLEKDDKTEKPAATAFRFMQEQLLPLGRPVSRNDETTVRLFEFGDGGNGYAVWGSKADLTVLGDALYFDTSGRPVSPVTQVSDAPVIILGQGIKVSVDPSNRVADTHYQYNQPPWSYFASRPNIGLVPLEHIDGDWTSFRGAPDLSPLQIGDIWITTARFNGEPYYAIERFTATTAGLHQIEGSWQTSAKTEPLQLIVRHNRKNVTDLEQITPEGFTLPKLNLTLEIGDTVDFELIPTGPGGDGAAKRRIWISTAEVTK